MGACNSCELIDETRFWRWEESPIPDSPTQLLPVSTDTRRAVPADVTPTELPGSIIAMQNAPAAPDPTGLGAALSLLGQSGVFKDITGLEGNQKNAAAALQQSLQTATTFGTKAADLALQGKMSKDIDKAMKTIVAAREAKLIDDKQATELMGTAIRGMVGAGATNPKEASTTADVEKITKTAGAEKASVSVTRPTGEKVEVDAREGGAAKEDSTKPVIILDGDTESAELRSFRPGRERQDPGDRGGRHASGAHLPEHGCAGRHPRQARSASTTRTPPGRRSAASSRASTTSTSTCSTVAAPGSPA